MPRGVYQREGAPKVNAASAQAKIGTPGAAAHRTTPVRLDETRSTPGISYIALKPMKVGGVRIEPGTLVPEAVHWRNVHNYVSAGFLAATTA